jgi:hypothetical protein
MPGGKNPDYRPESFDLSGLAYTAETYNAAMVGERVFYPLASELFKRDWKTGSTPKDDNARFPWQAMVDGVEVAVVIEGGCKIEQDPDVARVSPNPYTTCVTIDMMKSVSGPDRESILDDAQRDTLAELEDALVKLESKSLADQYADGARDGEIWVPNEARKLLQSYFGLKDPETRDYLTTEVGKIYEYVSNGDTIIKELYTVNGLPVGLIDQTTRLDGDHYEEKKLVYTDAELYTLHRIVMAMPVNAAIAKAIAAIRGQTTHTVSEEGEVE